MNTTMDVRLVETAEGFLACIAAKGVTPFNVPLKSTGSAKQQLIAIAESMRMDGAELIDKARLIQEAAEHVKPHQSPIYQGEEALVALGKLVRNLDADAKITAIPTGTCDSVELTRFQLGALDSPREFAAVFIQEKTRKSVYFPAENKLSIVNA